MNVNKNAIKMSFVFIGSAKMIIFSCDLSRVKITITNCLSLFFWLKTNYHNFPNKNTTREKKIIS